MALLGEGVRVGESITVGGVQVSRPDLRLGRENREALQQLLDETDFSITIDHPTWLASAAARQPLYFAVTPWLEAETAADAHRLLTHIVNLVADSLSLLYGGEPRTVGYVVQMFERDQESHAVVVGVGGPPWPTSRLQQLAPDNVNVPVIDAEDLYQSLARRPRAALWTHLFTPIAGEHRWDVRVLRLTSLLEGIARETTQSGLALTLPDGTPLLGRDGQQATTGTLRGRLYHLVDRACRGTGVPDSMLIAAPNETLWSEAGVWADFRNVIAHDGRWLPAPAAAGLIRERDRSEAAAKAATQGGSLNEGLTRYADRLMAAAEVVLRHAVAGGFDPPPSQPASPKPRSIA
ncbi:MAG: hypothetical protein ACYCS7_14960 [Acidimicrobiales bacterium]